MFCKTLISRSTSNVECQFEPNMLSDEDNEILSIMGYEGLKIKYQLKEEERQHERKIENLLLIICR